MTIHLHDNLQQSPLCQKFSKQITDLYYRDSKVIREPFPSKTPRERFKKSLLGLYTQSLLVILVIYFAQQVVS